MNKRNKLRIRDARPDDHEALREVALMAYAQYAMVMPHWELYREHILLTLEQAGPEQRIVAELNDAIVGGVLLYPPSAKVYASENANSAAPELRLLAVAPEARGLGVGRALLEECIQRARRMGSDCLTLHTGDLMKVARDMYLRMGFVHAPELDFSPAEGVHVKGYRLSLSD